MHTTTLFVLMQHGAWGPGPGALEEDSTANGLKGWKLVEVRRVYYIELSLFFVAGVLCRLEVACSVALLFWLMARPDGLSLSGGMVSQRGALRHTLYLKRFQLQSCNQSTGVANINTYGNQWAACHSMARLLHITDKRIGCKLGIW
jgi:hypothetical protein